MSRRLAVAAAILALVAGGIAILWRGTETRGEVSEAGQGGAGTESTEDPTILAARTRLTADGYRMDGDIGVPVGLVGDRSGPGVVLAQVVDPEGKPLPGREVRARAWRATGTWVQSQGLDSRRTDERGFVRWSGLPANGGVDLSAMSGSGWSGAEVRTLVGAEASTLVLWPRRTVTLRVFDEHGAPSPKLAWASERWGFESRRTAPNAAPFSRAAARPT